ncbi:hypothetical protein C8Q73DRAFT_47274 [Cubamyces lactineus]|nr:hypothetical protein C8Q73DRAFT_47274 [Cubamyces lactineus]
MEGLNIRWVQYDEDTLAGTSMQQEVVSVLVSFFFESLLFGAFVVTYTQGTWRLLRVGNDRRKPSRRAWAILLASTTMLVLALVHLVISLQTILYGASSLGAESAELEDNRGLLPKLGVYITQTLIADAMMMYRVLVVWARRRIVLVAPAILTAIGVATGYGSLIEGSILNFNGFPVPFCIATICTNVLCTVLIMWRILRSSHGSMVPIPITRRFALARRVAEAIVQSAAIYTVASASLLITYSTSQADGYLACLNIFPSLIGLIFSFIVLRLAKQRPTPDSDSTHWQTRRISARLHENDDCTLTLPMTRCSSIYLTPPLQIHLSPLRPSTDTFPVLARDPGDIVDANKPLAPGQL